MAFVSFHFNSSGSRGSAGYAIYFQGKGSTSALESSTLVQGLRANLGDYGWSATGKSLVGMLSNETRPRRLLSELDRIAKAFGSDDHHRIPRSRSRMVSKRLAVLAEEVLALGTWDLEMHSLSIWRAKAVCVSISLNPQLDSMLLVFGKSTSASKAARLARAKSHGYVDHTGKESAYLALGKLQPLSLRAAAAEARFLEAELSA